MTLQEFCPLLLTKDIITTVARVVGLVTNILNIAVLVQRVFKGSTFAYMLILAVVDLMLCVITLPSSTFMCQIRRADHIKYRFYMVFVFFPVGGIFSACSVWITMAMSVDRLLHILSPTLSARLCTVKASRIVCFCLFLAAVALHMPLFFAYIIHESRGPIKGPFRRSPQFVVYVWILTFAVKFLPVLFVIVINACLVRVVIGAIIQRQKIFHENQYKSGDRNAAATRGRDHQHARSDAGHVRTTWMLIFVSFIYLICHVPEAFSYDAIYTAINGPCSRHSRAFNIFAMVTSFLEMTSYATNIFPYVICSVLFRRVLVKTLTCRGASNHHEGSVTDPRSKLHTSSRTVNHERSKATGNHMLTARY